MLRTRIELFGAAQPSIQRLTGSDRILVELPGVKNKERVRQLLQGTAKLEFWLTYDNKDVYPLLERADGKLGKALGGIVEEVNDTAATAELEEGVTMIDGPEVVEAIDSAVTDSNKTDEGSLLDLASGNGTDSTKTDSNAVDQSFEEYAKEHPVCCFKTSNFPKP